MSSPPSQSAHTSGPAIGQEFQVIGSKILPHEEADRSTPLLQRKYTILKVLNSSRGASYGNAVCLCAWHTPSSLNPNLPPLLKRPRFGEENQIVVVKSRLSGGLRRDEQRLTELQTLRDLPPHDNVIALYDSFFTFSEPPQVHLVLGNMEGNLYHLIRARRGRALAGGLVSSILHQIALGLNHIHAHNYFHFNLCPEKILVTSLGLYDYTVVPTSPSQSFSSISAKQKDVIVSIKLSGFNLACRKGSRAMNAYAGFCWYRAPEVTLRDPEYSFPVDMWAFGAIIGEILRLQPLFVGTDSPLHVVRIAEMLGAPSAINRLDWNGQPADAGRWAAGQILAARAGVTFPDTPAQPLSSLFAPTTPTSLLLMLRRLLMYDPQRRLTSIQCLEHAYFHETDIYRTILPDGWSTA